MLEPFHTFILKNADTLMTSISNKIIKNSKIMTFLEIFYSHRQNVYVLHINIYFQALCFFQHIFSSNIRIKSLVKA